MINYKAAFWELLYDETLGNVCNKKTETVSVLPNSIFLFAILSNIARKSCPVNG